MNVSELIAKLQEFVKANGDIPVVLYDYEDSTFDVVDHVKLSRESFSFMENEMLKTEHEKKPVCVLWS
jgi:hypothetical protein